MRYQTVCKLPLPKVVKVSDIYPEMFKTYHPPCTVLHQCSKESGCCSEKTKCTPYKFENVTLYFKVTVSICNEIYRFLIMRYVLCTMIDI